MVDAKAVKEVAREKMGSLSRGTSGEFGMLARRLKPGEPICAMAFAKVPGWFFAGRIIVATPERLLLVGKSPIARREHAEEIALSRIRSVRVLPPMTLELELDDGNRRLTFVSPAPQLSALAAAARGHCGPARFDELDELVRRKLGRMFSYAIEGSLVALTEELGPEEAVLDVASWLGKPRGLVVACDARLVALPQQGFGFGAPVSVPFTEIAEIHEDGDDLIVRTEDGEHRFEQLAPPDRAGVIAQRIRARVR